jgi:ubiquinol-cytochrome c reductase cytochrome c1 subunit
MTEPLTMRALRLALAAALALGATAAATAVRAAEAPKIPHLSLPSDGIFGTFDRQQLQRGLKVYTGVCANCHGLRLVAYRNLVDIGLTPSQAREVAAAKEVDDIGDDGQPKKRKAELTDRFVSPFPNIQAAAATHGKAPPDLSLMVKAREGGASYCYALLTGYGDPPKDWKDEDGTPRQLDAGQFYNRYFVGNVIKMAPPFTDEGAGGAVDYGQNSPVKPTVEQMSKDVCAFLAWTSEPTMEVRKRTGIKVMLFLLIFTGVAFVIYRRVWRNIH